MIYGLQIGAPLLGRNLEEGLKDYEPLTEIARLQGVELNLALPALRGIGLSGQRP